tara:strand:+ start:446 stop:661 length:216 start_codon:yes stop_codon:yes gene_type:complete
MILNKLTDLYNQWGDDNKLSPLGSADEELFRDDIDHKQYNWLKNFIEVWEHAEEVEDFIDQYEKERKERNE